MLLPKTKRSELNSQARGLPMISCVALLLLVIAGCASQPPAPQLIPVVATCPLPPAPPAWAMQPASNSLKLLDSLFSISAPESSPIKQP